MTIKEFLLKDIWIPEVGIYIDVQNDDDCNFKRITEKPANNEWLLANISADILEKKIDMIFAENDTIVITA